MAQAAKKKASSLVEEGFKRYRKAHNDSLLGSRVARDLLLENEAGQNCAVFQIRVRCAEAYRKDRIYHG